MRAFRFPGPLVDESPALARLWDEGCLGLVEDGSDVLAYFANELESSRLAGLSGRWEDVAEVDHVAAYFAGLGPVRGGSVVIAPTHTRPTLEAYQQVVWLDPSSAFGTGHHETTRMAVEALDAVGVWGRSVVDVGSGSGILAIAADRLGAWLAVGVDIDEATLGVARQNAEHNRSRARFYHGSLDRPEVPLRVDVVVANLYAELHVMLLPSYLERVTDGGDLLLTGILNDRAELVREAIPTGLSEVRCVLDGEWSLLHLRKDA